MIPKIIHYCWFGRGKKPELAEKCIASWKKFLPDYKICEWNEDNFDLNMYPYAREAYDKRKFAFVTDVVRLYVLSKMGGVYFDTDVEVLSSLDPFLGHNAFSGFENEKEIPTGLMASEKDGAWVNELLDYYNGRHFVNSDGTFDATTNVKTITAITEKHGLITKNSYQDLPNYVTMYPKDYFCPKSYIDGKIYLTNNTVCIHHFSGSWIPWEQRVERRIWLALGLKPHRIMWHIDEWLSNCLHINR